ncbi:MAG: heavy metal translocating P-type ATPase metal-binding domain-containing protein [Chitinophagales bacterium]|nr:heavy metal translocating P-type ATPase metal-binding domain-containing protein [Chitinophagales bacterium]
MQAQVEKEVKCYHCGDVCGKDEIVVTEKHFCCDGCKLVYEMLQENGLCTYYQLEKNPGIKLKAAQHERFSYLNDASVQSQLIQFQNNEVSKATFEIPAIHCASCIWLLENLFKLREGILGSEVNFIRKETTITYDHRAISLKQVVELLASIGYEPSISLEGAPKATNRQEKLFYYRLGVAGFAFGNIMLLSFPEYLSAGSFIEQHFVRFFAWINLILALPVFFFSSSVFFTSAYESLKRRQLNLDVPLALGILVLFGRTVFEIVAHTGAGYADSLAGLVFLLLVGRWFQGRTYERLSFERNYKHYFPVAVTRMNKGREEQVTLDKLAVGDKIVVRNEELVPADAVLLKGEANINYSFVTGEAEPVARSLGQIIFAGGRQEGCTIELQLTKQVSQSYLTGLWNHKAFEKQREDITTFSNKVSRYFTPALLLVAVLTFAYWAFTDIPKAFDAFTAILIVACPCALALSSPFLLGNAMAILGKNKLYLKDTTVIERLSAINEVVFDKTGTITLAGNKDIVYSAGVMPDDQQALVKALVRHSNHPLSSRLRQYLGNNGTYDVKQFSEVPGKGISGLVNGIKVKLGSAAFVDLTESLSGGIAETRVWVSFNGVPKGYYAFTNQYRPELKEVVAALKEHYTLSLISGDNEGEKTKLQQYFGQEVAMHFKQSPHEKLHYIEQLQQQGKKVLMLGDGLNDAGALKQSDAGISVSDNINNFSPACDAILDASQFGKLPAMLAFSRAAKTALIFGLLISGAYNAVGLYYAVQGNLSPVVAAILMPLSSVSVVAYGVMATQLLGRKYGLLGAAANAPKVNKSVANYEIQLT